METKTTNCQDCGTELTYTTKKPNLCDSCRIKKFGDRKPYKQPKSIPKKSKGEFALNKLLNEMIPDVQYIDGGYYSFLKSPKGFPMQLDRYYPRLHLAFEFNGKQHVEDSSFFYQSEEQWKYQQTCDELKKELCEKLNIKIIYVQHDEYVCKELIIKRLKEANMLDFLKTKNIIL
jgi:hypothetical protein